jgi:hypothetical protein
VTNGVKPVCDGHDRTSADWDPELTHFLPDPEGYVTQPGLYTYAGRLATLHTKSIPGGKTQSWKLYTDPTTGHPIAYVAHAISLFDFHCDIYVLTIEEFVPFGSAGYWQLPSICNSPLTQDPYPESRFNLFLPRPGVKTENQNSRFSHLSLNEWLKHIHRGKLHHSAASDGMERDICENWDDASVTVPLPREFSWRNQSIVGPVRDQCACGSCWAFGSAEAVEAQLALHHGEYRAVSTNQIVDCTWDTGSHGCAGGDVDWAYSSMMQQGLAIAWEDDYPYIALGGVCWKNASQYRPAGKVKACYHIPHRKNAVKKHCLGLDRSRFRSG